MPSVAGGGSFGIRRCAAPPGGRSAASKAGPDRPSAGDRVAGFWCTRYRADPSGARAEGSAMSRSERAAGQGRVVIETAEGITVYPARWERDRWRAVWYEDAVRRHCQAVSEERLAAKLAKIAERLAVDG